MNGYLPYEGDGGNYTIAVQYPLPGGVNATTSEVSAVEVDIRGYDDPSSPTTISSSVALTFDATLEVFAVQRPISDLDGLRFLLIHYKPTVVTDSAADGIVGASVNVATVSDILDEVRRSVQSGASVRTS